MKLYVEQARRGDKGVSWPLAESFRACIQAAQLTSGVKEELREAGRAP